ncbi:nucleoside diphosphate kinase 3 isoform X2 [Oncorhynchus mykiss]|uniref:nucleoside diphosphate kinase 3 isoform X2 n=1 Tax=Oncorhynchus mykiss TaxID=8022 RepID=UPI000B4F1C1E|nr:nucleoside diphosphate kinase 3 isoform X2 [Oncorhynchus mykiss]XP_046162496.1 nucleoside diphosphate kinase 3-like isoform X2 [Oncorhynchus gorbuscha]
MIFLLTILASVFQTDDATMIFLLTILASVFQTGWTGVNEHSFIAVKPDGVHRRLVGEIIQRFEKKGFRLVGMKLVQASEDLLREHYRDLRDKPFFNGLVRNMSSGPIVAMVWQGLDVVKMSRKMLGETNPADSLPGTIRGDYCLEVGRNVIHGSDSVESAQREISLWFRQNELQCWEDSSGHWIYE